MPDHINALYGIVISFSKFATNKLVFVLPNGQLVRTDLFKLGLVLLSSIIQEG